MRVKITLTENMLGTTAKSKEIYTKFIEGKKPPAVTEVEVENVVEAEESGWTGFLEDENGLFVYDYFVKGFFKHSANVQKDFLKIKALRSKITDFVFIFPRKIYLGKKEPDGVFERPRQGMTPRGPTISLARSDFIAAGTTFWFDVRLFPPHPGITPELIIALLDYGQYMGFGQFRNGGFGRFTFEIEK
jgi:hypothetical protein